MGWNAKIGIGASAPTHRVTPMSATLSPTTLSNALRPPPHRHSLILLNTWSSRRRALRFHSPCTRPLHLTVRASSPDLPASPGNTSTHLCIVCMYVCMCMLAATWYVCMYVCMSMTKKIWEILKHFASSCSERC
jgi:hypothetical protein